MNKIIDKIKKLSFTQKVIGVFAFAFVVLLSAYIILPLSFSSNNPNTSPEIVLNNTDVEDVKISNITLREENGTYKYKAIVEAKDESQIKYIKIILKDENSKEIVSLIGYVGVTLSKGEKRVIEASTDADLSIAKSIDYEVIR